MKKIKVYVAAPYRKGDVVINVRKAIDAGETLVHHGFIPFVPHLTHFWHLVHSHDPEYWYSYDNYWLDCCDCLLRLPGESKGADDEMQRMLAQGKLVFLDLPSLIERYGG